MLAAGYIISGVSGMLNDYLTYRHEIKKLKLERITIEKEAEITKKKISASLRIR